MADRLGWPRDGRCGACGRPAIEFPSGRWKHRRVACRAASQDMWTADNSMIRAAVKFVPAGEDLPLGPDESHWHPTRVDGHGIPEAFGWCRGGCVHSVREFLAAEAASREVGHG